MISIVLASFFWFNAVMYREPLAATVVEPLTLPQAKVYARVEHANDDTKVTEFITTAREYCENFTKRRYVEHKFLITLNGDELCNPLKLESRSKIASVESFDFFDDEDVKTAIDASNFRIQNNEIILDHEFFSGLTVRVQGAFEIKYTVTPDTVKQSVRDAMGLLITHWYENREAIMISDENVVNELPAGVKSMLSREKVTSI